MGGSKTVGGNAPEPRAGTGALAVGLGARRSYVLPPSLPLPPSLRVLVMILLTLSVRDLQCFHILSTGHIHVHNAIPTPVTLSLPVSLTPEPCLIRSKQHTTSTNPIVPCTAYGCRGTDVHRGRDIIAPQERVVIPPFRPLDPPTPHDPGKRPKWVSPAAPARH